MNWIRISTGIADDPDINRLADALGVNLPTTVGLVICLLTRFPEHAADGNLGGIPARLVEKWAGWEGERGVFDAALREHFCNADGVWESWEKHNGRALKKLERDRERLRLQREAEAEGRAKLAQLSRNGSQPVAGTDGRTDEVHKGWRKRGVSNNETPANTPWCIECQGVVVTQPSGLPKMVHAEGCSRA